MDEEELEKPSSKINLGSFFERIDSVEKVADNALTKSNVNFSVINNQKLLINSINVSIEAMETKIRDIANYIIIEKKVEKDAEQDRLLEQEDKEQKKSMLDRALAVGQQGPKGDPGKPAEQQQQGGGGSFIGGLLKGVATLGISAFAIKYIGPVLLPKLLLLAKTKLIPIIGTALKGGFVKLAALLGKVVTGLVAKIPFIGKALAGSALFTGVGAAIIGIGNFISNALSGKGGGGGTVTGSNVGITDPTVETGMTDTMQKKDLVPAESFSEYRNRTGNVESEEEEVKSESNNINVKQEFKEGSYEFSSSEKDGVTSTSSEFEGTARFDLKTGKAYILGEEVTIEGYNEYVNLPDEERFSKDGMMKIIEKHAVNKVEPLKENVNIQVQKQDKDLSLLDDTNRRVDNIISSTTDEGNKDQNTGTLVQAETPQVAEADIKPTEAPMPFFRVIKNPHIANSPKDNKLPPEILRMIS